MQTSPDNLMDSVLTGIQVVSLAINAPGPVAAARLRDMGAAVIKIEPPAGDPLRHIGAEWYDHVTHGMEVRTLDLKQEEQRQELDGLLSGADLLLTASRPAALQRLRLGWDELHANYGRLCHVAIVGFPPPHENVAGHDLTYQADLGTLMPPHMPRVLLADMAGAERAVSAALALLFQRERTGKTARALVALSEAAADFAITLRQGITAPGGFLGGGLPNYAIYAAKSGWLAVATLETHFFEKLLSELGRDTASQEELAGIFLQRTAAEWENWAAERDLPLAAIREVG